MLIYRLVDALFMLCTVCFFDLVDSGVRFLDTDEWQ